jgi:hypothetical protein
MEFIFSRVQLSGLAVHRVGNKHRGSANFVSQALLHPNEALQEDLLTFFLKPLRKSEDLYHLTHSVKVELNEIYAYAKEVFEDPDQLLEQSSNILKHLHQQSDHPNIKDGELYVAFLENIQLEDELVDGLGIFKSERKTPFLDIAETEDRLELNRLEGISLEKLDKGCLIINTEESDGYRVLSVDNNDYDALYWPTHFLSIDHVSTNMLHTRQYLELCNDFAQQYIAPQEDHREKVRFMANSVDYFQSNEEFDFAGFSDQLFAEEPKKADSFRQLQEDYGLKETDHFPIAPQAIQSAKRKIRNNIKLDTNIQIRLDFNNPEVSERFIEKGYDEEKGMYYYKVFFNEEQ